MAVQTHLQRNGGHPWDGRQGFDLLHVRAETQVELNNYIQRALAKHWATWIAGQADESDVPACLLYKPSGARGAWSDTPESRHPGGSQL
jgi:crotonobetainyl-CoA:carnitine CoA-transferase CaiB-like acyl-CoA transferase